MLVVGSRGTKTIIWEHNTARMLQVALSDPRYILPKAQKAADGKAEGDAAEGSAPKEAWPGLRMAAQTTEVVGAKKGMTCLFDILLFASWWQPFDFTFFRSMYLSPSF